MAIKLRNKDYIWSYVGVIATMGAGVIMLPFILYYLSDDMYGLWTVLQSVTAISGLFDFGFSITFARNINYCWCGVTELKKTGVNFSETDSPNFSLMKKTMEACRIVFLLLSSIALVCMLGPGTVYFCHISKGVPGWNPLPTWAVYAAAVFFNLYYGYFNSFLRGVGALSEANRITVIARVLQIVLTVALLMCGAGLLGAGLAYLISGFVLRLLSKRAFLRFHGIGQGLSGELEKVSRAEIKELFLVVWYNAKKEGIVALANYLADQACTIICPLFLSLSVTGVYGLSVQIITALSNLSGVVYSANQPVLQAAYISDEKEKVRRTMSLIVVSCVGFYIVGLILVILIGLPVLRLISKETTPPVVLLLGVSLYHFVLRFRNCYTSYFSCTNRILYAKSFIFSSVLCVLLAVMFLEFGLGIWGLLLAQATSQIIYNFWYWPLKAHREMELDFSHTVQYGTEELRKIVQSFLGGRTGSK